MTTRTRSILPLLVVPPLIYACWLGMMAVHELGHVLHAWLSGGTVSAVRVPLAGFSITEYSTNPRPHFVAWGGAIWGCLIPLAGVLLIRAISGRRPGRRPRARRAIEYFAGFCLIANGVYVGAGWAYYVGDAADLLDYGTPRWVMTAFGAAAAVGGLYLWHRLGRGSRPGPGAAGNSSSSVISS